MKLYGDLLAPVYKDVYNCVNNFDKTFITLKGGRFSAKGDTVYTLVGLELAKNEADAFIFAPQQSGIKNGVMAQVLKVFKRLGLAFTTNQSINSITLTNGSRLFFKGLDASRQKTNNDIFKGLDSDKKNGVRFLIFDELSATKDFLRVDTIIQTLIRQPKIQIIEISNPPRNKTHPIYRRYRRQEQNNDTLVLHTTVYDLPIKWLNKEQIKYINDLKENNKQEYNHSILGLSGGVDGLAFEFSDKDIWTKLNDYEDYIDFQVFTDEATVNATSFCLYGITTSGEIHLIDTFYHSSKDDGNRYSPSDYAEAFHKWIIDLEITPSKIITDGLPFTMELRKLGYKSQSIGKLKDRALSYYIANKLITEKTFKIVDNGDNHNLIFYNQLLNAEIVYNNNDRPMIDKSKESGNDNTIHTHALDTFLYFCLANQKMLMKGDTFNNEFRDF